MILRLCLISILCLSLRADEGMWLFNDPPAQQLKEKYGFEPSPAWLEHVQKSSVRFNSGGSGSFVSADGLVMTNHHVGADCLAEAQHASRRTIMRDGFLARTPRRGAEVPRPGAERPDEHRGRHRPGERRRQARPGRRGRADARRAVIDTDREGVARQDRPAQRRGDALPGRPVSPVPLQEVHRRAAGLRARAADRRSSAATRTTSSTRATTSTSASSAPTRTASRRRRSTTSSGAPAGRGRRAGVRLRPPRAHQPSVDTCGTGVPARPAYADGPRTCSRRREVLLKAFSDRSAENARRAEDELFGVQNWRKARIGLLAGLLDPALFGAQAAQRRTTLRQAVPNDPEWKRDVRRRLGPDRAPARSLGSRASARSLLLERGTASTATCSASRATWCALADENCRSPTPSGCASIRESELDSLEAVALLGGPDLRRSGDREAGRLAGACSSNCWAPTIRSCGRSWPGNRRASAPRSWSAAPSSRTSPCARSCCEGGQAAIDASGDPMIELARSIDPAARSCAQIYEDQG